MRVTDITPIVTRAAALYKQCNPVVTHYENGQRCARIAEMDTSVELTNKQLNKIIKVDIMADNAFNTYKTVKNAITPKGYTKMLCKQIDDVWTKYFATVWKDYQGEIEDFCYESMDKLQEHVEPHRQKLGYAIQSKLMMIEAERRKQVTDLELCLVDLQCANKILNSLCKIEEPEPPKPKEEDEEEEEKPQKHHQMLTRLHTLIFQLMNHHAGQLAEAVNLADSKQILLAAQIYEKNVIEYELFEELEL